MRFHRRSLAAPSHALTQLRRWGLACAVGVGLGACSHATGPKAQASTQASAGADEFTAAQQEAKAQYDHGRTQLRRGTYAEAQKTFEEVKTHFPYSPYAALAELAQADTFFRERRYIEAADGYRSFLRYHPAHAEVRYALGQVAESQFAQVPEAWWFMPPVAEKDPSILHQAIEACDDYLARYKEGAAAKRAEAMRTACLQKLADHELYVARFYYKRKLWAGARARALNLLATYPKLSHEPQTLWLAGSAAFHQGDAKAAHELLEKLLEQHPHAAEAKRARVLQARILRQEPES